MSFYRFRAPDNYDPGRSFIILAVLFLSWGITQIVNDHLGLAEDRINAPHRPMVTGELPAKPALFLLLGLMAGVAAFSWSLNPWSVLPVVAGVPLNILYEHAKTWSLWGNAVFGVSISMCTVYGFLAAVAFFARD